jgi:hypothetical protein
MKYGFVKPEITPDNWVLGSITAPKIFEPQGDWTKYLPEKEIQAKNGVETYNCTSFGTLSIIETLINRITSETKNYSDRFVGIMAGTKAPGNSPHVVAEAIRKNRLLEEAILPFSDDIRTIDEYYSFKGANPQECKDKALEFPYELNHYWLWTHEQTKEERTEKIREALKYSPLGISVSAWYKKGDVYVDNSQPNNHWTMLYGEDKKGWKVFDSYDNTHKILSFDHNIEFAKGYHLVLKEAEKVTLLKKLIELYQQLLSLLIPKKEVMETPIVDPKENQNRLYNMAKSLLGKNLAPGMELLGCAISMSATHNKAFPELPLLRFVNTTQWYDWMMSRPDLWEKLEGPEPDAVIVNATDHRPAGSPLSNGHIGIIGRKLSPDGTLYIMSNNGKAKCWDTQFTLKKWIAYYEEYGKIETHYFRRK